MVFHLFNHRYYRISNCCLGCRIFKDDHCLYTDDSSGHCYGFCLNPILYVQSLIPFDYDK